MQSISTKPTSVTSPAPIVQTTSLVRRSGDKNAKHQLKSLKELCFQTLTSSTQKVSLKEALRDFHSFVQRSDISFSELLRGELAPQFKALSEMMACAAELSAEQQALLNQRFMDIYNIASLNETLREQFNERRTEQQASVNQRCRDMDEIELLHQKLRKQFKERSHSN